MRTQLLSVMALALFMPQSADATLVCVAPVFKVELELRQMAWDYPDYARSIANNILYLREKYCREISEEPDAEETEQINELCSSHSGTYRDETVYWGQCGD